MAKSNDEFIQKVQYQAKIIFGVNTARFVLIDKQQFRFYEDSEEILMNREGITHRIAEQKHQEIIHEVQRDEKYIEKIDGKSFLPIFYCPIMIKKMKNQQNEIGLSDESDNDEIDELNQQNENDVEKVIGVLQIVLKQKGCFNKMIISDQNEFKESKQKVLFKDLKIGSQVSQDDKQVVKIQPNEKLDQYAQSFSKIVATAYQIFLQTHAT